MTEAGAERLVIATFAERPDLLAKVFEPEIQSAVPEFMRHDPAAALYYGDGRLGRYLDYGLVAVDPAEPDRPVARAFSVPFAFPDGARGRETLPDGGWDQVIRWAYQDRLAGQRPTAVSALEIMVAPRLQGRGVSRVMLAALRDNACRLGFADLYAPLRPTDKHREPRTPFAEYVARRREDGLPHDFLGAHPSPLRRPDRQGGALQYGGRCHSRRVVRMDRSALRPKWPGDCPRRLEPDPCRARTGSRGLCRAQSMGPPSTRLIGARSRSMDYGDRITVTAYSTFHSICACCGVSRSTLR